MPSPPTVHLVFVLAAGHDGQQSLVRKREIVYSEVQEIHHRLGEAVHFLKSAKGEQPALEPLLQTCVTEVRRILAPERPAPAMRFTTQVPLANTTLYAPPPPPDPKAKAPPPAAKAAAAEPIAPADPSDHSIPFGNAQVPPSRSM